MREREEVFKKRDEDWFVSGEEAFKGKVLGEF